MSLACGTAGYRQLMHGMHHLQAMPANDRFAIRGDTLLFRGTIDWKDLVAEARIGKCRPWADENILVHRGFHDLYVGFREELMREVETVPIRTICGHSLGGVFALLCANDMRRVGREVPKRIFTVGAPRVGNRAFAKLAEREWTVFRVANDEDIVPRLPPLCTHVGVHVPLRFDRGSIRGNHCIEAYAHDLVHQEFALQLDSDASDADLESPP